MQDLHLWKSELLSQFPNILHGSVSRAGELRFGRETSDEEVIKNRRRVCEFIGIPLEQMVLVTQKHTADVLVAQEENKGRGALQADELGIADGMVSSQKGICLVVKTADCVPVFLYDKEHDAIAMIHAGWKGTVTKIVPNAIELMQKTFNTSPSNLYAAMGPSIHGWSYDVTDSDGDRIEQFKKVFPAEEPIILEKDGRTYLDNAQGNKWLLNQAGVTDDRIEISEIDTLTNAEIWPSFRNDQELWCDMWSFIMIKE